MQTVLSNEYRLEISDREFWSMILFTITTEMRFEIMVFVNGPFPSNTGITEVIDETIISWFLFDMLHVYNSVFLNI